MCVCVCVRTYVREREIEEKNITTERKRKIKFIVLYYNVLAFAFQLICFIYYVSNLRIILYYADLVPYVVF